MILYQTLFVFGGLKLAASIPLSNGAENPLGITQKLFDSIEQAAHFAAAAYCPSNTINSKVNERLSCPKSNSCPKVEAASTSILTAIKDAPKTDVTGYVARDASSNVLVIAFQGTESPKQAQVDLNLALMDIGKVCSGCKAHTGFWQSWLEAEEKVLQVIKESKKKYPNDKLIVTGHSLGGAIATLTAADFRSRGIEIDLYAFAAPRIGNQKFADYVQHPKENHGKNYRVTHYNDPVPRLPPSMMGYAHYTPEVYISSKTNVTVKLADILNLDAASISKGNEQFTILDANAHSWYFNMISSCYAANTQNNVTDLGANWAVALNMLMGGKSGLTIINSRASNTAIASAMAGLIASMSTTAANAYLDLIPGGFLVKPFIPSALFTGTMTATSMAALLSMLEWFFKNGTDAAPKSSAKFLTDLPPYY